MTASTPLLDAIDSPEDLRRLPPSALPQLCKEVRQAIMAGLGHSGGHMASNLGAVEIAVAAHYVLDSPRDHIVWDVGHQAYAHKILTGRKDRIGTIRSRGGLAPFPKISESPYDAFGVGHSSTSIGAALGMAAADRILGRKAKCLAIIGDGAMTAGMAYEALNNIDAAKGMPFVVLLNDNEMSISPNVGALPRLLANAAKDMAGALKRQSKDMIKSLPIPGAYEAAKGIKSALKGFVETGLGESRFDPAPFLPPFADLGLQYIGPVDGHDPIALVDVLREAFSDAKPKLVHVKTVKGKGYLPAENDPVGFHSVGKFDPAKPPLSASAPDPKKPSYSEVFGRWACAAARRDPKLVAITPAMREGSGLVRFSQEFPDRYFDVGIAEQHAVTFAAGLAARGCRPVVAIYSTFLQRAYDQAIHDVAIQNLPVLFAVDRAGVVGQDGPTHIGAYDLCFLRCIPNMIVAAPSDEAETCMALETLRRADGPAAVRYPRGKGPGAAIPENPETIEIGKSRTKLTGKKLAVLAFGPSANKLQDACARRGWTLIDMRFVKPIDKDAIAWAADNHDAIATVEEGCAQGGAGSATLEALSELGKLIPAKVFGLPDAVIPHGLPDGLLQECGLAPEQIESALQDWLEKLGGA